MLCFWPSFLCLNEFVAAPNDDVGHDEPKPRDDNNDVADRHAVTVAVRERGGAGSRDSMGCGFIHLAGDVSRNFPKAPPATR